MVCSIICICVGAMTTTQALHHNVALSCSASEHVSDVGNGVVVCEERGYSCRQGNDGNQPLRLHVVVETVVTTMFAYSFLSEMYSCV